MADGIFNVEDVASFLNRSEGAVRNLVLRRKIPYRKVQGRLLFLESEIRSLIESSPGVRLNEVLEAGE